MQQIPTETLVRMVGTVAGKALHFTAHTLGDGAVATVPAAYEEVGLELPLRKKRPSITHCNFMSPESIVKAASLGAVIDLQPIWLYPKTVMENQMPEASMPRAVSLISPTLTPLQGESATVYPSGHPELPNREFRH